METTYGHPLHGPDLEQTRSFLRGLGLNWEEGIEATVNLWEGGQLVATGSRQGNVLKCIGVSGSMQGEGLSATIVTELVKDAFAAGHQHLFLYTKPENLPFFSGLGFYTIASVPGAALLENRKNGVAKFVSQLRPTSPPGLIGCVVANCNPFTNGHLYLMEQAALACDFVHLFILSEDRSFFPADVRLQLAQQGTAHIKNLAVHSSGSYLISTATFPHYFTKDKADAKAIGSELDLAVFATHYAPPLRITRRFVGTEPFDRVTAAYNRQMLAYLPAHGVQVTEIPRREVEGDAVSASRVRKLLQQNNLADIRPLVPPTTYTYLEQMNRT